MMLPRKLRRELENRGNLLLLARLFVASHLPPRSVRDVATNLPSPAMYGPAAQFLAHSMLCPTAHLPQLIRSRSHRPLLRLFRVRPCRIRPRFFCAHPRRKPCVLPCTAPSPAFTPAPCAHPFRYSVILVLEWPRGAPSPSNVFDATTNLSSPLRARPRLALLDVARERRRRSPPDRSVHGPVVNVPSRSVPALVAHLPSVSCAAPTPTSALVPCHCAPPPRTPILVPCASPTLTVPPILCTPPTRKFPLALCTAPP